MTSHLLSRLKRQDDQRKREESCIFCNIIEGKEPAHIVYETDDCVAFLDILPIRAGALILSYRRPHPRRPEGPRKEYLGVGF